MTYDLKWAEETAWAVIVAGLTYIVSVAAAGMPTDNWRIWLVTVAAGVGRIAFATVISRLGPQAPAASPLVPAADFTTNAAALVAPQMAAQVATPVDPTGTLPRAVAVSPTSASPTS